MNNKESDTPPQQKKRSGSPVTVLLGLAAVANVVCGAFFGYEDPSFGIILIALGVAIALIVVILGFIFGSSRARQLAYIAFGLSLLAAIAGALLLLVDKTFEDRCVEAWQKITERSEALERRFEDLEDRFERD